MVITLTDVGTKKGTSDDTKMYFPVIPEQITYSTGAYFEEYRIMNKGAVKIPNGEDVSGIKWESFFPGTNLQSLPFVSATKIQKGSSSKKKTPTEMHNQLEAWKSKGAQLKLNITGTPFSFYVYIEKYEAIAQDAHGSIYYTIEFVKAITVSVSSEKKKTTTKTTTKKTTTKKTTGTSRSTKKTTKKHTIKKGDTLWGISKKYYKAGSKWKTIYNANKTTIENAAKKRGYKSSNNGNRIWPGTVLKIP